MPARTLDSQVVEDVSKGSPELLSTGDNLCSGQLESVATGIAELCNVEQTKLRGKKVSKIVFFWSVCQRYDCNQVSNNERKVENVPTARGAFTLME